MAGLFDSYYWPSTYRGNSIIDPTLLTGSPATAVTAPPMQFSAPALQPSNFLSGVGNAIASHPNALMAAGAQLLSGGGWGGALAGAEKGIQLDKAQMNSGLMANVVLKGLVAHGANPAQAQAIAKIVASGTPHGMALGTAILQKMMAPTKHGFMVAPNGTVYATTPESGTIAPVGNIGAKPMIVPAGATVGAIGGGAPGNTAPQSAATTGAPNQFQTIFQNQSGLLKPQAVDAFAKQWLAGDTSVLQNLGRTAAGAINVAAVRNRAAALMKERGIPPREQALRMAEFQGLTTSEKTLGTRLGNIVMAANEAAQLAPQVLAASANVNRTKYPLLNEVVLAYQRHTGSPGVVRLGQTVLSLANAYGRAVNPSGVSTDASRKEALDILSPYWASGQIQAGVQQLLQEIEAIKRSPNISRDELRKNFMSGAYSGTGPHGGYKILGVE